MWRGASWPSYLRVLRVQFFSKNVAHIDGIASSHPRFTVVLLAMTALMLFFNLFYLEGGHRAPPQQVMGKKIRVYVGKHYVLLHII